MFLTIEGWAQVRAINEIAVVKEHSEGIQLQQHGLNT